MKTQETALQRFWQRVFDKPESACLLVPNKYGEHTVNSLSRFALGRGSGLRRPPKFVPATNESVGKAVATITAYLRVNGFKPGDRAAVMAWNCPEWVIADLAIQSMGGVTVPIYPHSSADVVRYHIEDSGAKFFFTNETEHLHKVGADVNCTAVLFGEIPAVLTGAKEATSESLLDQFSSSNAAGNALLLAYVEAELRDIQQAVSSGGLVSRDQLATLIYTSGSTGTPKGVMLTHGNFAAACEGMLGAGFELDPKHDVYLSYLPLAHVYERACGTMLCLWAGVPIAFCGVTELAETLNMVRPTLVHGVPKVWRKIKDNIDDALSREKGAKAKLIRWAFAQKKGAAGHWLADKLVFAKIRGRLGGRIRLCTSGGAAISAPILSFFDTIGIELLQGYGLTETTGASFVSRSRKSKTPCNKIGSVGPSIEGVKVRIQRLPSDPDSDEGEIQLFGPTMTGGYWHLPEETANLFTADGWLKTGDKGRLDSDNVLWITGRIKRLLKTDGGKYVAPDKIEKAFEGDPIVQYIVPVGDGKPYISGLVFVDQQLAGQLLKKNGVVVPDGTISPSLFATYALVLAAVDAAMANANAKLERWETVKKVHIVPVEATVGNGLLTPTLKIRTEEVLKRYKTEAEAFYKKAE